MLGFGCSAQVTGVRALPGWCACPADRGRMQSVINTVKGKALEVAEYLTPVLKVRHRPHAPRDGVAGRPLQDRSEDAPPPE